MRSILTNLSGFVAPRLCMICEQTLVHGEEHFCLNCNFEMPRTHLHLAATNRLAERLARLQPTLPLAAWFHYVRGSEWAHVIRRAKYSDSPRLARRLGMQFAREIVGDGFFDDIDCLVPVPMHWLKRLRRSYNQAVEIATGVSQVTGIPIDNSVFARRGHATQTRQSADQRSSNVQSDLFDVRQNHRLSGRTVLVIDDVVTTGSTIEAIVDILHSKAGIRQAKILCLGLTESN